MRLYAFVLRVFLVFLAPLGFLALGSSSSYGQEPAGATSDSVVAPFIEAAEKRWSKDIRAFDELNAATPKNDDAILFIGSSSIRRWTSIATDMAPYRTIRRGYGGAKYTDLAVFAERIIQPHSYRALVIFVGNGVVGKPDDHTPEQIEQLARFVRATALRHRPDSPVFFIEITPCEKRFDAWPKIRQVNARLREVALSTPNTYFISTASHYLLGDGTPRSELFVDDQLHLNPDGYRLWAKLIRRRLDEVFQSMARDVDRDKARDAATP